MDACDKIELEPTCTKELDSMAAGAPPLRKAHEISTHPNNNEDDVHKTTD